MNGIQPGLIENELMTIAPYIERIRDGSFFSRLDIRFADLMVRISKEADFHLFLAAALVSRARAEGNVCLDLAAWAGQALPEEGEGRMKIRLPSLDAWTESLSRSPVIGNGESAHPLVMDAHHRLYLRQLWEYEKKLADSIHTRVDFPAPEIDDQRIKTALKTLFKNRFEPIPDWQEVASLTAVLNRFCVISGGPGTGKTYTAARILALIAQLSGMERLRIFLAAPTGKAAAKLKESIRNAKDTLPIGDPVKEMIPEEAFTIHRLLGSIPGKHRFRFNAENQLPADLVIVDEASMVDLPLMSKLLTALPMDARLVFIGDQNQLASVESGFVLGDICGRNRKIGYSKSVAGRIETLLELRTGSIPVQDGKEVRLGDGIVELKRNYRFSENKGIIQLSRHVNHGDADDAMELLYSENYADLEWISDTSAEKWNHLLNDSIVSGYGTCFTAQDPSEAIKRLDRFKILCAVNKGPQGVVSINHETERILKRRNLIRKNGSRYSQNYRGKPILITLNQHDLELYNGDLGIVWTASRKDAEDHLYAFFPGPEESPKRFPLYRLPAHETAYAMTVHKSQGSEFEEVLLVLPQSDIPLLTRELLYTAITRAKKKVILWGNEAVIRSAICRRIERTSGLLDALWKEK